MPLPETVIAKDLAVRVFQQPALRVLDALLVVTRVCAI